MTTPLLKIHDSVTNTQQRLDFEQEIFLYIGECGWDAFRHREVISAAAGKLYNKGYDSVDARECIERFIRAKSRRQPGARGGILKQYFDMF